MDAAPSTIYSIHRCTYCGAPGEPGSLTCYSLAAPIFGKREIIYVCSDRKKPCRLRAVNDGYNWRPGWMPTR